MTPAELRRRAEELDIENQADVLGARGFEGAAALLAALANWDPGLLRRALLARRHNQRVGEDILRRAVEIAKEQTSPSEA